jgi:dipeptidyl aminopeptidase/acylaminoacyl peptidase
MSLWGCHVVKEPQACGGWPSSIGSADLVEGALRLSAPRIHEGVIYWLEGRPGEGGRQALMAGELAEAGQVRDLHEVCPAEVDIRTRVHEYGGGEYAIGSGHLFFVDDRDGRIHQGRLAAGHATNIAPISRPDSRYADLVCSRDGRWLIAVEERPRVGREPENRLVAFELDPNAHGPEASSREMRIIASGHDFYASPVFAPKGDQLAFLAWDHPNMPWNGTTLESMAWATAGPGGSVVSRGGGPNESIFQPRYSASGELFAVSDRSGWWNLMRFTERGAEPVHVMSAELGRPQWVFGMSTWDFLGGGAARDEVLASATQAGRDELIRIDIATGKATAVSTGFCSASGVESRDGWVACLGGSPTSASALYAWRVDDGTPRCIRENSSLVVDEQSMSRAEACSFESSDGRTTHAFVYRPTSASACPRPGERPPLLIKSHGGPTSATSPALDPRIQYWTSRGFAVADVNYGGSSGYGRSYRDLLERAWGVVDVEDCVAVAKTLGADGVVDPERLAISGGSAGGYTTLCALTFYSVFAAGASHYGIGDLEALARDTHKFESRYTDWLVGQWPAERDLYAARSPIHHHERLACPVIFFQGLEDRVVPPNQAEAMVAVLARRGIPHAYVPFEGEQHGFRRAENIRTALDGELYFYSRVFGFEASRPEAVHVVGARPG